MAVVETKTEEGVGVVTISRPEALNAINSDVMEGLLQAVAAFDADDAIGCIVLTGAGDKAFVAGADIKEMASKSYMEMYLDDRQSGWEVFPGEHTQVVGRRGRGGQSSESTEKSSCPCYAQSTRSSAS